jgi:hypothetical protein
MLGSGKSTADCSSYKWLKRSGDGEVDNLVVVDGLKPLVDLGVGHDLDDLLSSTAMTRSLVLK